MPMPESYTLNRNVLCVLVSSSSSTSTYTWPVLVNLMALDSRLSRIWRRRSGSPMTSVRVSGPMKEHISSPLLSARDATESTASSMTPRTSKSTHTSSSFPASTLVRSRMSLMSSSSDCDEMRICSVNLRCSAVRAVSMTSWFMPMMTLSGVRISCDMVARNCDLASLAACAWKSSASCSMSRRISVMSWPTPMTPTMLPLRSRRDVALSSTSTRRLSLVKRGNSKLDFSRPWSALSSTSLTEARNSLVMYTSTRSLPMTSSLEKPVMSAALLFHSFTLPLSSIPKIGALAVSMKVCNCCATRTFSASTRLRSVMSCPTPITPTILPSTPRFDVTLSKMSIRLLSASSHPLVITCISKFDVPRPSSALRRTSDTWSWKSGSIRTFTNSFPMTISLVRPEICADC
mmetsp:Transcript_7332/g.22427  ORF Transcript_7332/g.22427 Transcript_7332/m.22427 type:complete len:404 (+) Transcript_7332:295-1506(+)